MPLPPSQPRLKLTSLPIIGEAALPSLVRNLKKLKLMNEKRESHRIADDQNLHVIEEKQRKMFMKNLCE